MKSLSIIEDASENQYFVDAITKIRMKCAFNLNESCGPDCAACSIGNLGTTVTCDRIDKKDAIIGLLPSKNVNK